MTGLTSFIAWALRVCISVGMVIALVSIFYGLAITVRTLMFGMDLPGWSTLVVAVSFLDGIQLISIGVLDEYLAWVFTEVKDRAGFIVAEDR